MPQEHHVLRCVSCETFQVHIVKKTKKWECKICGTKQSVKRNYGKGSGKDCRSQVMKLNELRVLKHNISEPKGDDEMVEEVDELKVQEPGGEKSFKSKWTEYLDENSENGESEEENTSNCLSEKFEKKKTVKRMPKNYYKSKKICRDFKASELFFESCDEINHLFSAMEEESFKSSKKSKAENDENCFAVTEVERDNSKKNPNEAKCGVKKSKYAKYWDDDEENANEKQIYKSSNIFSSDLVGLDNLLNF